MADVALSDDGWGDDGDAARPGRGRAVRLRYGVAALVVGALVVAGWYGARRWEAARSAARDAKVAGDLHHKLAVGNQPLSDDEFGAALSLCDAADPETRFTALLAATADAVRHHPERRARVVPVAARLAGDGEADVRAKAVQALAGLRAREHLELVRPLLRAADPRERKAAEEAVAVLEADAPTRAIVKEPAYRTREPRYCQLVFGPKAKQSAWLVIDGEDLYVDRNGNGDLTEDGERSARRPAFQGGGFEVPELAVGGGGGAYANLIVYWTRQPPGGPLKDYSVEVMVEVDKRYCQYAVFKASAASPKDAPVIHFGGPLEMVLLGPGAPLAAPGKEQELAAAVGTKSPTGHLAMVRHDRKLSPKADVHPVAEVTFPGGGGADPAPVKLRLDQRCCNVRFYATLRTPAEAGVGKAKVSLSFPGWTDIKVGPTTKEVVVTDPDQPSK